MSQALRQPRPAPLRLGEDGSSGDTLPFSGACLGWEHKCLEGNTMSSESFSLHTKVCSLLKIL